MNKLVHKRIFCIFIIFCISLAIYHNFGTNIASDVVNDLDGPLAISTQQQNSTVHAIIPKLSVIRNSRHGFHDWCVRHQRANMSYTSYADKHTVKEYVQKTVPNLKIAKEYEYVLYAKNINEELLSKLPADYVFKANHLSGGVAIIQNNVIYCVSEPCPPQKALTNMKYLRLLCNTWLQINYANVTNAYELYYGTIEPKCMFEELLGKNTGTIDYKIYTFYGKPYLIQVDIGRFKNHLQDYYTPKWKRVSMKRMPLPIAKPKVQDLPSFLEEMLDFCEKLSRIFIMMRVDFFAFGNRVAFQELSPSPDGCNGQFFPIAIEKLYGYISENAATNIDPETITIL